MEVPLQSQSQDQDDAWYTTLKQNLLELTAVVAPHYDVYDSHFFSSRAYRTFENEILEHTIGQMYEGGRDVFADLGCATGPTLYRIAKRFKKELHGFDISAAMIEYANGKLTEELRERVLFRQHDLEKGIPLDTHSVSFVAMNLGTASDIRNIGALLSEIQRVLIRSGRFLLSFYNRDALVYSWNFLPWPISMAAEMDHERQCLNVHTDDGVFPVYARAYTSKEVQDLMPNRLKINCIETYPAISSILPESALQDERATKAVLELDKALSVWKYGAYLIVTGERSLFD